MISALSRFFLEAVAFGGILIIILYQMSQTENFNNILPILSLYVFAGYRMIPTLQQIYVSFNQLAFVGPSLNKLYDDFKKIKTAKPDQEQGQIFLNKTIDLNSINYTYPNVSRTTLKDINLSIPAKSTIGLIGATGSGKTTTVDIILGLLEAQKGTLEVDG